MESTTPGGTATSITPAISSPQQHAQPPRQNKPPGRRKPRPQHDADVGTSNPASQSGNRPSVNPDGAGSQLTGNSSQRQARPSRPGRPPGEGQGPGPAADLPNAPSNRGPNRNQRRKPQKNPGGSTQGPDGQTETERSQTPTQKPGRPGGNNRRAKFQGKLTTNDRQPDKATSSRPADKYRNKNNTSAADDLTTRLIQELSFPPYPDCPICFSSIHRDQPIWSCSPSIPTILPHDAEGPPQYCWTTFHLKCIRSWAAKSVKDIEDAWIARGEEGKTGDWRCPGCQGKREIVPKVYWCFCGTTPDPKPPRLSTPHSCGGPCSRDRDSGCGHPCPLSCHPGPCPPCQVTTRLTCYCPRKSIIAFRCGADQGRGKGKNLSCGNACGRTLTCGKHACEKVCHEGPCDDCPVRETSRCWCGKSEKELGCGEGEVQECFVEGEEPWVGRYACDQTCERKFDCGVHTCQKGCHPPSHKPAPCPRSPANVTHCPCGRSSIAPSPNSDPSPYAFPARTSCTSPIPTCNNICNKPNERCGHACRFTCHLGPCPPCSVEVTRPCRCGASTKSLPCYELYKDGTAEEVEILCTRPCTALRACGKHECRRPCCPLASLATTAGKKGKKRMVEEPQLPTGIGEERGGLHECDLVCGKPLSCGNHSCEERDHKGACPPCLRSSFDEMICFCGRTVYEPPIPCGTPIRCSHPCPRSPPPCGHPRIPHACHEDPSPCPPCVHLTSKQCACGKKTVLNVRCSLESEKVSCGTVCGKLLACGFHHCDRSCHADDCGPCTAMCGKVRKLCLPEHHPCPLPCHAPSSCSEADPCPSLVTVSCPCGRITQAVRCGRSSSNTSPSRPNPKCTNECGVAKRNARLAEALGIDPTKSATGAGSVSYSEELTGFARINPKFVAVVERAFADFVTSPKKIQVLPHTPPDRRKFVQELATYYRIDTSLVDQEPHRSVQLHRRLDTRIPSQLLSATLQQTSTTPSLGKLGDLRNMRSSSNPGSVSSSTSHLTPSGGPSWRPISTPSPKPALSTASASGASGTSGWSSIVTPQPQAVNPFTASRTSTPNAHNAASNVSRPQSRGVASRPGSTVAGQPPPASAPVVGEDEQVPENWEDDD